MSGNRLVVLDERDYDNLLTGRIPPPQAVPSTLDCPPAILRTSSEPSKDQPQLAPPKTPEETATQTTQEQEESVTNDTNDHKSPLEDLVSSLTSSAQPAALDLLEKLSKIPGFSHDKISGNISIRGKPLDYTLGALLRATCRPSARDDVPRSLLLFLAEHGIHKFKNKKIRKPRPQWRSLYSFPASTTDPHPAPTEAPRRYSTRRRSRV